MKNSYFNFNLNLNWILLNLLAFEYYIKFLCFNIMGIGDWGLGFWGFGLGGGGGGGGGGRAAAPPPPAPPPTTQKKI